MVKGNKLLIIVILGVILLLLLINNLFFFSGYYGFDDVTYSKYAYEIYSGNFSLDNQFSYRWSVIFPTALAYKIFGYNDFSRSVFPILTSVVILYLLSFITKYKNYKITFLAIILTITNQWYFYYSDKIMADIYVALSYFMAIVIIFYYKFYKINKPLLYALLLSLSLFLGFVSKGTIILIAPVIAVVAINDIIKKQNIKFWIFSSVFSLIMLVLYFISIKLITGTYLMRFYAIDANSYINDCSYDKLPAINTIKRISFELILEFLKSKMFIPLIFSISLITVDRLKNIFNTNNKSSYIFLVSVLSLLSANFMTISYKSYIPMCTDYRHYMFLTPIIAISGAIGLYKFLSNNRINYIVVVLLVASVIVSYLSGIDYVIYIILFVVLLLLRFFVKKINLSIILITLALIITPIQLLIDAYNINWKKHNELVNNYILKDANNLVITSEIEGRILNIYSRFNKSNVETIEYSKIDSIDYNKYDNIWWLSYWITGFYSEIEYDDKPFALKNKDSTLNYIYVNDNLKLLRQNKPIVFYNNFENKIGNWSENNDLIDKTISLSGVNSNFIKPKGYSLTLEEDLSYLNLDSLNRIVRVSVNYLSNDSIHTQLVVSIEDNGNSILWQSKDFNETFNSKRKWNKAILELTIPNQKSGILKVYVWNTDTNTVRIDNFKIIIF